MNIYVSEEILNWYPNVASGTELEEVDIKRSYEILFRAEKFVNYPNASDDDKADCISNLRKCITHRIRLIDRIYGIRKLLEIGQKQHYLKILSAVRVVRPMLLFDLIKIRNKSEYEDHVPHDIEVCRKLSDIVWYFLRSTDSILDCERNTIELTKIDSEGLETPYGFSLNINYKPRFSVSFCGWLTPELVLRRKRSGLLEIKICELHTRTERWNEFDHLDKNPEDIWISGELITNIEQKRKIIEVALSSPNY